MEQIYKKWLEEVLPKSAAIYFKKLKEIEKKFKIENIFEIDEKKLNEYISQKKLRGLDENSKSYLNKFREFKGFEKKNIKLLKSRKTELEAILFVTDYFENQGYAVESVEGDCNGYDLVVKKGKDSLTVEVKGISKSSSNFILSHNEHSYLDKNLKNHRICVVKVMPRNKFDLYCFKFNAKSKIWVDDKKNCQMKFQKYLSSQFEMSLL